MQQDLISYGKCPFCKQEIKQAEIRKHLATHLAELEKKDKLKKTKRFVHIVVQANLMFLHILVDCKADMEEIDYFLRKIWLDCCDHLSDFSYKNGEISMDDIVENVFLPKVKIYHDYDYGSTTRVELNAYKTYSLHFKESLILVSRNEPLKLMCAICKNEPAVNLCAACFYSGDAYFCKACSRKHNATCYEFGDYSKMPVVNSPRMGVCGYDGGTIDKKRDKAYVKEMKEEKP